MEKILEKSGNFVSPEKWEPFQGINWLRLLITSVKL